MKLKPEGSQRRQKWHSEPLDLLDSGEGQELAARRLFSEGLAGKDPLHHNGIAFEKPAWRIHLPAAFFAVNWL